MKNIVLNIADIVAFFHSFSAIVFGSVVLLHVMTRTLPNKLRGRNGIVLGFYSILQGFALNCSMFMKYEMAFPHIEMIRNILFITSALFLLFFAMKLYSLSTRACLLSLSGFLILLLLFVVFSRYCSLYISIIPTLLSFLIAGSAFYKLMKKETCRWARNCLKIISGCFFFYSVPCLLLTILMEEDIPSVPYGEMIAAASSLTGTFCVLLSALMIHQLSKASSNNWLSIIREVTIGLCVLLLLFYEVLFFVHYGEKKAKAEARQQLILNKKRVELTICKDINMLMNLSKSKRFSLLLNPDLSGEERDDLIQRTREIMLLLPDYQPFLVDHKGRCVLTPDKKLIGKDFSAEKYIALSKEKEAVCFACISEVTGLAGLYSCVQIRYNGKHLGYLVLRADLDAIQKSLLGMEHLITVVSGQRKIIFSNLPEATGKMFISASGRQMCVQNLQNPASQEILMYQPSKREDCFFAIAQLHVPYLQSGTTLVMGTLTSYPQTMFLLGIHSALLTGLVLLLIWFFVRFRSTLHILDQAWNELRRQFYIDSALPCLLLNRDLTITGMNKKAGELLNFEDRKNELVSLEQILPDPEMCARIRRDMRSLTPVTYQILIRTGNEKSYLAFGMLNTPPKSPGSRLDPPIMFSFLPFIPESNGLSPIHSAMFHAMETFSRDKIFMMSPNGVFLSSNDPVIADRIKRGEQIKSQDFLPPESAAFFQTMLENVLTSRHSFVFEVDFPREFGGYRYMVNLFPVLTPDEHNVCVLGGIAQDRSVQFKLEQTLRRKMAQGTEQAKMDKI